MTANVPLAHVGELIRRERAALDERIRGSEAAHLRAAEVLPGGVASSFQFQRPWPIHIAHGEGARVWDLDGNEYIDLHAGFGAMVQGHAHPAIVAAVSERARLGTHFGAPTEEAMAVAEELARRFGLPRWRFTNSGTEATMAAVRLARALTGRDDVLTIAGAYHGHHDTALAGRGEAEGIPSSTLDLVHPVPFNDSSGLERTLAELAREGLTPACLLMEAATTHRGVVPPEPGYLEAVRGLTRRHGVLLVLDEVKTGLTIAAGGAVERFGLQPDIVTLAKVLGAGLPSGAVGMSEEVAGLVEAGRVPVFGTFNGNPLGMAAARAGLLEVLTPEAYERLERLGRRMADGMPAPALALGAKGCVPGSADDPELAELAWLWAINRGVLMTRGRGIEWTLSVAHTEAEVDRCAGVFGELAAALSR
jgi:glutamate-1-semialdehyde 2,1-aminomutase